MIKLLVFICKVCDRERPCVLSGLVEGDDAPSSCPLNSETPKWEIDQEVELQSKPTDPFYVDPMTAAKYAKEDARP